MDGVKRWEKIESLFDEALERPRGEQRAWLAKACPDDEELRREVEDMLAAHQRTKGALEATLVFPTLLAHPSEQRSAEESDAVTGPTAGPYRLLRQIGRGGMGVVYRAHDPRLDRDVALKFLPWRDAGPEEMTRFRSEAKAASALDHPNICTIHDIGETEDGQLYIAMAFYEGETLAQRIARGQVPVDEAVDLALQAAAGLAHAHEEGIVHRDVKPSNLMVTPRPGPDRLKIVDFGIAKLEGLRLTEPGSIAGTLAYMAPEQLEGEDADPRADIWSLGVVLYETLTGELPFGGAQRVAIMRAILQDPPGSLRSLRPEVPRSLEQVVEKALSKLPEERQACAAELISELEHVKWELTPAATSRDAASPILMTLVAAELADHGPSPAGDVVGGLLDEHGGREIGHRGSGVLRLVFERPWNAVSWALACQRALAEAGARVGIHLDTLQWKRRGGSLVGVTGLDRFLFLVLFLSEHCPIEIRHSGSPSWYG